MIQVLRSARQHLGKHVSSSSSSPTTRASLVRPLRCCRFSASASSSNEDASSSQNAQQQQNLFMWGTDTKGSLWKPEHRRDESKLDVPALVEHELLAPSTKIQQIICGPTDTAILLESGDCYVAGENKRGQLGLGHTQPVPDFVRLPVDFSISQVSLGVNTAGYVDSATGDLYTCGSGGSVLSGLGLLGHSEGESCTTPTRVDSLVEDGCEVQQVQMSEFHTTVLTTEGEVLTCGAGSYGRLGNFETVDQLYLEPVEILTHSVTQLAGGKGFTLALTNEGVVYGWGRNHKGQLGTGLGLAVDMYAMQSVPEPLEADELLGRRVVQIAAGHSHAACITASGELFFWGMSEHLEPARVNSLLHTKVVDVACGQDYTLALGEDGKLYSWGQGGSKGVLGHGGAVTRSSQATVLEALAEERVSKISAGWVHAACLTEPIEELSS